MSFWNELVQSMINEDGLSIAEPTRTYKMEMWIFIGITIVLLFLLILALITIVRGFKVNQYGMVHRSEKYNGAPVNV